MAKPNAGRGSGEFGPLIYYWQEYKMIFPLKTAWQFPIKVKMCVVSEVAQH